MTEASTTAAVDLFQKSWRVYQDIIEHNYMFHREISAACRTMLQHFQPGQRLRILDLGCGDASMVLPLLAPDRIAFSEQLPLGATKSLETTRARGHGSGYWPRNHWAASGLEDTLLRCQIQPEYLNGHYQKEVQQGI
ncbi:MAG: hypothetical protein ACMV0J_02575 [Fluviibacter sp.]